MFWFKTCVRAFSSTYVYRITDIFTKGRILHMRFVLCFTPFLVVFCIITYDKSNRANVCRDQNQQLRELRESLCELRESLYENWNHYARTRITMRELESLCENSNHYERTGITMRELESLWKNWNHYERTGITMWELESLWENWNHYERTGITMRELE